MRVEVYRSAPAGSIVTKLAVDTEGPKLAELRLPLLYRSALRSRVIIPALR